MTWKRYTDKWQLAPFRGEILHSGVLQITPCGPLPEALDDPWLALCTYFDKWIKRSQWAPLDTSELGGDTEGLAFSKDLFQAHRLRFGAVQVREGVQAPCFYATRRPVEDCIAAWQAGRTVEFSREDHVTITGGKVKGSFSLEELIGVREDLKDLEKDNKALKEEEYRYAAGAEAGGALLDKLTRYLGPERVHDEPIELFDVRRAMEAMADERPW